MKMSDKFKDELMKLHDAEEREIQAMVGPPYKWNLIFKTIGFWLVVIAAPIALIELLGRL